MRRAPSFSLPLASLGLLCIMAATTSCKRDRPQTIAVPADAAPRASMAASPDDASAAPPSSFASRFQLACTETRSRSARAWEQGGCVARPYDVCIVDGGVGFMTSVEKVVKVVTPSEPTDVNTYCKFDWKLTLFEADKNAADARAPLVPSDVRSFTGMSDYMEWGMTQLRSVGTGSVFLEITEVDPNGCVTGCAPSEWTTHPHTGNVYSARNHRLVQRADLGGRDVYDVRDVDKDGRLDFVLASPFFVRHTTSLPDGKNRAFTVKNAPTVLAHALPDGGVSLDDAVSRSFVKAQCPQRPPVAVPSVTRPRADAGVLQVGSADGADAPGIAAVFEPLEDWIPCAKFWGATVAQMEAALRVAGCTSFVGTEALETDDKVTEKLARGVCPAHLRDWARTEAPFILKNEK